MPLVLTATMLLALASAETPAPIPVLSPQPGSPLEILSMRSNPMDARFARYDMAIRNTRNQPVMAFAIRHETVLPVGVAKVCHSSMGFSKPMIAASATKNVDVGLARRGTQVTPVIDFVLFADGSTYGQDTCGTALEYRIRGDERKSMMQVILKRMEQEGPERTTAWLRQQLAADR